MVVHLSYNIAGRADLAGLKQLLVRYKPDFIFMQEVVVSKDQIIAHIGREYDCQVNVDIENEDQPGTAIAWRTGLVVTRILHFGKVLQC